jgi:hypothetical protein
MFILFLLSLSHASIPVSFLPSTATPPRHRMHHVFSYSLSYNSLVVFGGLSNPSLLSDIYYFNLDTHVWSELIPLMLTGPGKFYIGPRQCSGGFVSEPAQFMFIFSGENDMGPLNDLWGFSSFSQRWFEFDTFNPPSPRTEFGFVHYSEAGVEYFAVFGGSTLSGLDNGLFV